MYDPADNKNYPGTMQYKDGNGFVTFYFDDGQKNNFGLSNKIRLFQYRSESESTFQFSSSKIKKKDDCDLLSDKEPIQLRKMAKHSGKIAFLRHEAQGLKQYM